MDCKGMLKSVTKDWITGRFLLTFEVDSDVSSDINKLAEASGISKNRAHNLMLRRYGKLEEVDGHLIYVVVPDDDEGENKALEAETYHIKPTGEVKVASDGTPFRTYIMLRGSSTYDTDEMSKLIDGLVSECQEMGIETLPPQELERMMDIYDQHYKKRVRDG